MEGKIYNKLLEHDAQFEKIDARFDKIEAHLEEHDAQFVKVEGHFKNHDEQFEYHREMMDFLAQTAAEHSVRFDQIEARLENTSTKDDIRDILNSIDWLIGNAKKQDDERVMMGHALKRMDSRIDTVFSIIQ